MTTHEPRRQVLETPGPVKLHVENGRGRISVRAAEQETTDITLTGARADEVRVTQDGRRVDVRAPSPAGASSAAATSCTSRSSYRSTATWTPAAGAPSSPPAAG